VNPTEVIPNLRVGDIDAARSFYTDYLGLDEESFNLGWVAHFRSSDDRACVQLVTRDATSPEDSVISVRVGDEVDEAYAEARRRGYEIVHPLQDEPWGVRRFLVRAPDGNVVNIVGHRDETVTVETLRRLVDAFNAHDLDAVMSYFADDCVLEMPRGPEPWGRRLEGRGPVREGLASRFAGLPDVHYGDDRHWVSGNRGCSEWLLTGTSVDGERIEVRGCDLFEFEGDKIVRKDSYWKIVEG
jgi:catechol 2,3-dioxygenase-like lactoylglutathione lyase family enzyme/ketosteroid isomerase-like protein